MVSADIVAMNILKKMAYSGTSVWGALQNSGIYLELRKLNDICMHYHVGSRMGESGHTSREFSFYNFRL